MSVALSSRSQVQFSATFNQREINACASSWLEIKLKGKKLSACFAFNFCLRRQAGGRALPRNRESAAKSRRLRAIDEYWRGRAKIQAGFAVSRVRKILDEKKPMLVDGKALNDYILYI